MNNSGTGEIQHQSAISRLLEKKATIMTAIEGAGADPKDSEALKTVNKEIQKISKSKGGNPITGDIA